MDGRRLDPELLAQLVRDLRASVRVAARPARSVISRSSRETMLSPMVRLANRLACRSAETKAGPRADAAGRRPWPRSRCARCSARSRRWSAPAHARPSPRRRRRRRSHRPGRGGRSPWNSPPAWVQSVRRSAGRRVLAEMDGDLLLGLARRPARLTSSAAIPSWVSASPSSTPVQTPSRMMATRSACSASSASRCDTRMTTWPASASSVHAPEEVARLLVGERGVRLVEQEDARVAGERAPDLVRCRTARGTLPERHDRRRRGWRGPPAARAPAASRPRTQRARALAADHEVLGDREVREQLRLLVDDRHAVAVGRRVPRLRRRARISPVVRGWSRRRGS